MENDPLYILLADDDKDDRVLFTEAFAELKIKTDVTTVNNGVELMKRLNDENIRLPQLLFLDLNMPRKNGIQCLKEIRKNDNLKDISVAIYSTSNSEKDIDETFRSGANIYITKPTDFNILKTVLERAVMTAYQYQQEDMKRENFLFKIW
jgi:CheY-like chemotaxis protein